MIDAKLGGRILEAAVGLDPWDAAVHLALGLGLRREEVLGLAWEHVEDGTVRVRRTLTAASGELHFGPPKSKAGKRDLPMPMFVAEALRRHRLAQGERALSLGLPRPESVVSTAIGEPFQPASFSKAWKAWAGANGFTGSGSMDSGMEPQHCCWPPGCPTPWRCGRWAMPTRGSWLGIRTW